MRFLRTLLFVIILSSDYAYCQTQVDYCYDKSGSSESEEKIKASLFGTGLKIENFQILGSVCKYSDLEDFELGDSGVLLSTGNSNTALSSTKDEFLSINKREFDENFQNKES